MENEQLIRNFSDSDTKIKTAPHKDIIAPEEVISKVV